MFSSLFSTVGEDEVQRTLRAASHIPHMIFICAEHLGPCDICKEVFKINKCRREGCGAEVEPGGLIRLYFG